MTNEEREKAEQPMELSSGILNILFMLWRYKWILIGFTVLAAAGSIVFALVSLSLPAEKSPMPNYYRAEAVVLINGVEDHGGSGLSFLYSAFGFGEGSGSGLPNAFEPGQLAIEIIKSPIVLDRLIDEFDIITRFNITESVRAEAREELLKKGYFSLDSTVRLLRIAFEDIDPVFAQQLANRTAELVGEWFSRTGNSARSKELDFLSRKTAEVSDEIARLQTELRRFQRTYGVVSEQDIAGMQKTMLSDLRTQLVLKEIAIKNHQQFSTIEDHTLRRLRAERDNLRDYINRIERGEADVFGETDISGLSISEIATEYSELTTQIQIQRTLYEQLIQQYELAKIAQQRSTFFQVILPAEVPDKKAGPSRGMMVIRNTILGFLLPALFLFLRDRTRRILAARDRENTDAVVSETLRG